MDSNKIGEFEKGVSIMSDILMYISGGLLLIMLLLGISDVTARYLLNKAIVGTTEFFEVLMPGMVLLSLAYTQKVKAHITVDLFISKFPARAQAVLGIVVTVWAIILFGLVAWQGTALIFTYYQSGRVITNTGIPMYLPRMIVPLGAATISLVFVVDLLHFIREIRKNA